MPALVAWGWGWVGAGEGTDRGVLLGRKSSTLTPSPLNGLTLVARPGLVLAGIVSPEKGAGDWDGYCIVP